MLRELMRAKIHRATVTDANLDYVGSCSVDADLLRAADLQPYEKVMIANLANGERFETYVIEAPPGSGTITLNGAAAHLGSVGDLIILIAYGHYQDAEPHTAHVVFVDRHNRITRVETQSRDHSHPAPPQTFAEAEALAGRC